MSQPALSSQYLRWFQEIEKSLGALFRLFSGLCGQCYSQTMAQAVSGERAKRGYWCCCVIDNQVHDHWTQLNAVQIRADRQWYQKMKIPKDHPARRRFPGNGPCPALGPQGCQISRCRPITCTTQLCEKMLYVLAEARLISGPIDSPRQIEDIISLPDILPALYGCRKNQAVTAAEVQAYLAALAEFTARLARIDVKQRRLWTDRAITRFMAPERRPR